MAAKDVLDAVKAAQLYIGCSGQVRITDEQRLYNRMTKKIEAVAKKRDMSVQDAHDQIVSQARKLGGICPTPGKDI